MVSWYTVKGEASGTRYPTGAQVASEMLNGCNGSWRGVRHHNVYIVFVFEKLVDQEEN